LLKTDEKGDILWDKIFGGTDEEIGSFVQQTPDGGYICVGYTGKKYSPTDLWLIRTDSNGDTVWTKTIGGSIDEKGYCVKNTSGGGYIITGSKQPVGGGNPDVWLIKIDIDLSPIDTESQIFVHNYQLNQNYPNPFNPCTTIEFNLPKSEFTTLKVYNILGKEVSSIVSKKLNQGNHTYQFEGKNLASGIYYYQLVAGDFRQVKKMILLR